jgi:hypothetical protein
MEPSRGVVLNEFLNVFLLESAVFWIVISCIIRRELKVRRNLSGYKSKIL